MSNNIFTELKAEYAFLSRVEKSIADLILSDPERFITYSMTALSEACGVSQGSINNFAKKFSAGGFAALKLKIAGCLSLHNEQPFAIIDNSQSIKAAMEMKIKENMTAFRHTAEINDEDNLQYAVEKILAAKKIEIYGVFQSGIVAKDFCYQLIQLGIPATSVSDSLMCAVSASMLDSSDLVIAISASGRTKEIIDAVGIAKKNHVPVLGLTSNKFSPLAKTVDRSLIASSSGMSISDQSIEIRLSQMLLIDTLCAYIRSTVDVGGKQHYYKLRDILCSHNIKD